MEKCLQIYITFIAFTDNFDLKNIALQSIEVHDKPLQMRKKKNTIVQANTMPLFPAAVPCRNFRNFGLKLQYQ